MEIGNINNCLRYSQEIKNIMEQKKELKLNPPTLYHSIVIPCHRFDKKWQSSYLGDYFTNLNKRAGQFWLQGANPNNSNQTILKSSKYKKEDSLFHQEARNDLIKMLAVAVKGHYFLFKTDILSEPPSVFPLPDLNNIDIPRYCLVYPFASSQHALVVSRLNLDNISSSTLGLVKFPVVISQNRSEWLNTTKWKDLEEQAEELKNILKDNPDRKEIHEHSDKSTFPYGSILDVQSNQLPYMKHTGIRWAQGIQSWYLPKGFDVAPVQEYLDYLKQQMVQESDINRIFG